MKVLILFAAFVGLTFGFPSSKEWMLRKLDLSEQRLQKALINVHAHPLPYYQPVYENLLKQVNQSRESVKQLRKNEEDGQVKEMNVLIDQQVDLIVDRIGDPFPAETVKHSALYLAAMNTLSDQESDHSKAQEIFDSVQEIVRLEDWILQNPKDTEPAKNNLSQLYSSLESTLNSSVIPSFAAYQELFDYNWDRINHIPSNSFYVLSSEQIAEVREHLQKYANISAQMAQSWPINVTNLEAYFNLTKAHRGHELGMYKTTKYISHQEYSTVKDKCLDSLRKIEGKLRDGIDEFKARKLNYYVERLLLSPAYETSHLIESAMPKNTDFSWFHRARRLVASRESEVHFELLYPAEEETLKVGALYFSAVKEAEGFNDTSAKIKSAVGKLIEAERSFIQQRWDLKSILSVILNNTKLDTMRNDLKKMVEGPELRGINDDLDLENMVQKRVQDLKEKKLTEEASKGESELENFVGKTHYLNSQLPVDNDQRMKIFFETVKGHYESAQKLKAFMVETMKFLIIP